MDADVYQRELLSWLNGLEAHFSDRLLAIDAETARIWGELTAQAQCKGRTLYAPDGLIGSYCDTPWIALDDADVADFEATGALLINPW